jgi:hypothetical protein
MSNLPDRQLAVIAEVIIKKFKRFRLLAQAQ